MDTAFANYSTVEKTTLKYVVNLCHREICSSKCCLEICRAASVWRTYKDYSRIKKIYLNEACVLIGCCLNSYKLYHTKLRGVRLVFNIF